MGEVHVNETVISMESAMEFRRGKNPQGDSSASGGRWALKLFLMMVSLESWREHRKGGVRWNQMNPHVEEQVKLCISANTTE